jgi:hypothetical protein
MIFEIAIEVPLGIVLAAIRRKIACCVQVQRPIESQ